jgi:2-polyprenyl-6-methoxyphenol hydroxylase-like FAD-dependent oxidoreductase
VYAPLVVGADGVRSRTARAVSAPMLVERAPSGAGHYLYARGLDADGFEFHLGDGGLAGVFPTHDDAAVVWACVPEARALRFDHRGPEHFFALLDTFAPSLGERARAATVTEGLRSAVRMPNHVRSASGPGWALVGDAGSHRDPITGHGITDAFRDAELLAFHLGAALRGEIDEPVARARFGRERMCALLPIFDATTRIAAFPPVAEFAREHRSLSERLEEEATWLADRPHLPAPRGAIVAGVVAAVAA